MRLEDFPRDQSPQKVAAGDHKLMFLFRLLFLGALALVGFIGMVLSLPPLVQGMEIAAITFMLSASAFVTAMALDLWFRSGFRTAEESPQTNSKPTVGQNHGQ